MIRFSGTRAHAGENNSETPKLAHKMALTYYYYYYFGVNAYILRTIEGNSETPNHVYARTHMGPQANRAKKCRTVVRRSGGPTHARRAQKDRPPVIVLAPSPAGGPKQVAGTIVHEPWPMFNRISDTSPRPSRAVHARDSSYARPKAQFPFQTSGGPHGSVIQSPKLPIQVRSPLSTNTPDWIRTSNLRFRRTLRLLSPCNIVLCERHSPLTVHSFSHRGILLRYAGNPFITPLVPNSMDGQTHGSPRRSPMAAI
jgi:hypothetical protein